MSPAWFACYGGDLLASLRWKQMTPAQRGAYWQLICWQMQSEDGHLDAELDSLSALSDLDLSQPGHAIVLAAFPLQDCGRRANARALLEWQRRHAIASGRQTSGRRGADSRWHLPSVCHWQNDGKRMANANTSTSTSTSTSRTTSTRGEGEEGIGGKVGSATHHSPPAPVAPPKRRRKIDLSPGEEVVAWIPCTPPLTDSERAVCREDEADGWLAPIGAGKLAQWQEAYPDVDVPATLREIRQRIRDTGRWRKTPGGVAALAGRWLAGEQNAGRR